LIRVRILVPVQVLITRSVARLIVTKEEAYDELVHKVSWPTWAELQQSAIVVLVAAVIMALLVLAMDIASKYGTLGLYKLIH
jgi:preprotein translocase subunit SecE